MKYRKARAQTPRRKRESYIEAHLSYHRAEAAHLARVIAKLARFVERNSRWP